VSPFSYFEMIEKETIIKLAQERIEELNNGIYIVELKINSGNQILVELDKEDGSIGIEDCMSVSRNIEHNLDREIEDFSLEVSSAGLSQPLRGLKQYVKNIGKEVSLVMLDNGKKLEGVLVAANEEQIMIEVKEKKSVDGKKKKEWVTEQLPFKYNELKEVKLVITF